MQTIKRSAIHSLIVAWNKKGTGIRIISMVMVNAKEIATVSRKWFERNPRTSPHNNPGKKKINKLPRMNRRGASVSNVGPLEINQKKFIANITKQTAVNSLP
jgi:hypothetical protein